MQRDFDGGFDFMTGAGFSFYAGGSNLSIDSPGIS
jgi:hypothetical protein